MSTGQAWLSPFGMYQLRPDIFDNGVFPEMIDRENLLQNFMLETLELETIYPNADAFKFAFGVFCKRRLSVWEKLAETLDLEYDPLSNKDYRERHTTTETRDLAGSRSLNDKDTETRALTGTNNYTDTETPNTESKRELERDLQETLEETGHTGLGGQDTVTRATKAFNNPSPENYESETTQFGQTSDQNRESTTNHGGTETETTTTSGSNQTVHSGDSSEGGTVTNDRTSNEGTTDTGTITTVYEYEGKGNIGVTTSMQLIEAQREVVKFNLSEYIINDLIGEFIILVY